MSLGVNGQGPYLEYEQDNVDSRGIRLYEFELATYLIYWPGHFIPDFFEPHPRELTESDLLRKIGSSWNFGFGRSDRFSTPGLISAWSYHGFILAVKDDPQFTDYLKELHAAFCQGYGFAPCNKTAVGVYALFINGYFNGGKY